jgi:hypothetical protein
MMAKPAYPVTTLPTPLTTIAASISTGSQTVTPASMAAITNGKPLGIANADGSNYEVVVASSVTGSTFTATFSSTKTGPGITVRTPPTPSAPGGCFSSGFLQAFEYPWDPNPSGPEDYDNLQWYSKSSLPQLRLVPSKPDNGKFPDIGTVGDFFFGMNANNVTDLFLCLKINLDTHKPVWTRVKLDVDNEGGTDLKIKGLM